MLDNSLQLYEKLTDFMLFASPFFKGGLWGFNNSRQLFYSLGDSLIDISNNVINMFNTNRESDHIFTHACLV